MPMSERMVHEDLLPEMTKEQYEAWYKLSKVTSDRYGPRVCSCGNLIPKDRKHHALAKCYECVPEGSK